MSEKMNELEFARHVKENGDLCIGVPCIKCPLYPERDKDCKNLQEWAERTLNENAIMSREDMFQFITHPFNGMSEEDLEISERYFKELIKPIVNEVTRFYKGYMVGMAQNNQTICEPIQLPRVCQIVFNRVEEELKKEILRNESIVADNTEN